MKIFYKVSFIVISTFFLVLFGFPFVIVLVMSFKSQGEYMAGNYWGIPDKFFFGNYGEILGSSFMLYFLNSIIVAVVVVFLVLLVASMASYAFSKLHFKLKPYLFMLFLAGMMIPVHTTLIPIYQLTRNLGLTDTLAGLMGPYISFGLPVGIYIMTTYLKEIPASIQESAFMDGASHQIIYFKIMLPLSAPALSSVGIFTFLASWNEFIYSLTLISSSKNKTLPLGIREFYGAESINIPSVLTAILIGSLPVILFYMVAQERVINGLSAGAVKG